MIFASFPCISVSHVLMKMRYSQLAAALFHAQRLKQIMPTNEPIGNNCNENSINGDVMTTSTGSLKFEVVLEPPKTSKFESLRSPRPHVSSSPASRVSLEEIQAKLKHAESRRASVEAEKVERAKTIEHKLAEAAQRRNSLAEEFGKSVIEASTKKMEVTKENRDRLLNERVEKRKEYDRKIEEVRKSKIAHSEEVEPHGS